MFLSQSYLFRYKHEYNHLISAQLIQPYTFKTFLKNIDIRNHMSGNLSEDLILALLARLFNSLKLSSGNNTSRLYTMTFMI